MRERLEGIQLQECAGGALPTLTPGSESYSYSANTPCAWIAEVRDYGYRMGAISTPFGIVALYDQGRLSGNEPITSLDFVFGGRGHRATWRRTFTDRFLKTLAVRFARSIAEPPPSSEEPLPAPPAGSPQ